MTPHLSPSRTHLGKIKKQDGEKMDIHKLYALIFKITRKRRMKIFEESFPISNNAKIIDVGGYRDNWEYISSKPQITLINLNVTAWECENFRMEEGDGTNLRFQDQSFDIAYSNSVIEHVGDWAKQSAFAREIIRVAPKYFVQTPNRWFFFEPHLLAPFIHFLPKRIQRRLIRPLSLYGLMSRPSQDEVDAFIRDTRLLTCEEMQTLFPDARIHKERFLGMTRSIIAIKA